MHSLLHYLDVTKECRLSQNVFVSYVTFKSVSSSTIARWLKTVLKLSGIDISMFKAHFFRSASVSAAFDRGCSLQSIFKTADWSSDKTFRRFYCRMSLKNNNIAFAVFKYMYTIGNSYLRCLNAL